MSLTIPIETSARHIHLSQEDFKTLFGPDAELTYVKELSQPGQYACQERLTVVGPKGSFENVIVLGPCRSKTQVEVSVTDNRKLGIPSFRLSVTETSTWVLERQGPRTITFSKLPFGPTTVSRS